jgi:hypothetical protein
LNDLDDQAKREHEHVVVVVGALVVVSTSLEQVLDLAGWPGTGLVWYGAVAARIGRIGFKAHGALRIDVYESAPFGIMKGKLCLADVCRTEDSTQSRLPPSNPAYLSERELV